MSLRQRWIALLLVLGFQVACTGHGHPARYEQSLDSATNGCLRNPACYTQTGSEAVLPGLARTAQAAGTALATLRVLETAEVARIEMLLVQCARQADFDINEREYGPGGRPDDTECKRKVRHTDGREMSRQMQLGILKHEAAFACVRREILKLFPDNVSIEPRYGLDASTNQYVLTNQWRDSLMPDIVLHATRSLEKVQCVYDFKFPCAAAQKSDPFESADVAAQMAKYTQLGGGCPGAIITPQLGLSRAH